MKTKACLVCNEQFTVAPRGHFNLKIFNKRKYCSQQCQHKTISGKLSYMWKGGKPKCIDCQKQAANYKVTRCITCSNRFNTRREISRLRVRATHLGSKSHFWKGGVTSEVKLLRSSAKYKEWRLAVFERDSYTCVWCGARSSIGKKVILNADHIKPFAHYPELRFELSNGRTLCEPCHRKTDTYARKADNYEKVITKNLQSIKSRLYSSYT